MRQVAHAVCGRMPLHVYDICTNLHATRQTASASECPWSMILNTAHGARWQSLRRLASWRSGTRRRCWRRIMQTRS
jgi:hypothetical protein